MATKPHAEDTAARGGGDSNVPFEAILVAFQTVLTHGSKYLTILELGRVSICSKTTHDLAEECVWPMVFQQAVAAGTYCVPDNVVFGNWGESHEPASWMGEEGILDCFTKPDPRILASVGYKHASRCLLSKTCFHCGNMAGAANPVAMMRVCGTCAELNQEFWLMSKSKAKEAFLLSDKDISVLPSASFPYSTSKKPGAKVGTSVVLLISHVVEASYAKYGDENGLVAEFAKRKQKALRNYEKRALSSVPQKKRPKIEGISDRPANDLASLRYFFGMSALPIPTAYLHQSYHYQPELASTTLKMTHSVRCQHCDARGTTNDILAHERLEHNVVLQEDYESPLELCPPFQGSSLSIPSAVEPAEELVQLLAGAKVERMSGASRDYAVDQGVNMANSLFYLGECKIAIDRASMFIESCSGYTMTILFQEGQNKVPTELVSLEGGEMESDPKEAEGKMFDRLLTCLGLEQTEPSQLLAALISRAMPASNFTDYFCDELDETKNPVLHGAWTYLENIK